MKHAKENAVGRFPAFFSVKGTSSFVVKPAYNIIKDPSNLT
jgi:hypothetical protein